MNSLLIGAWMGTVVLAICLIARLIHKSPLKRVIDRRARKVFKKRGGPFVD